MKLEKWALIAEVISGVAIVATLVFLMVELRSNTNALRAQNRQAVADGVRQVTLIWATTPELGELFYGDVELDSMTNAQSSQVRGWFTAWLKSAEETYLQYRSGVLDEELWLTRQDNLIFLLGQERFRELYDEFRPNSLVRDFRELVDQALEEEEYGQ